MTEPDNIYRIYACNSIENKRDLILEIPLYTVAREKLPIYIAKDIAKFFQTQMLVNPQGNPYDKIELWFNGNLIEF